MMVDSSTLLYATSSDVSEVHAITFGSPLSRYYIADPRLIMADHLSDINFDVPTRSTPSYCPHH